MQNETDNGLDLGYPIFKDAEKLRYATTRIATVIASWVDEDKKDGVVLAFAGSSGAVLAALVAPMLEAFEIPTGFIQISKENEDTHRLNFEIATPESISRVTQERTHVVVIDDIMATGNTVKWIIARLKDKGWFPTAVAVGGPIAYYDYLREEGIQRTFGKR